MTTNEFSLSQAPTSRGWLQSECSLFAPASLLVGSTAEASTRMSTARSTASPGCAGSGQRPMPATAGIAPEDWDLLFRAALERLARVADEQAAQGGNGMRQQAAGESLRECIEALHQLRRSVPPMRWVQRYTPGRAKGDIPPTGLEL